MITTWSEGDEAVRAEQEADAREAMTGEDLCTGCGEAIEGEDPDEFWSRSGKHHRMHPACSEAWEAIGGPEPAGRAGAPEPPA